MTALDLNGWISVVGGAAVVALGLFVLAVKPRSPASVWFAVFAISFGGYFVAPDLVRPLADDAPTFALGIPFFAGWAVGVAAMSAVFPRPLERHDRPAVWTAAAVALVLTVTAGWNLWTTPTPGLPIVVLVHSVVASAAGALLVAYLVLLVLRYRASQDALFRRQAVLTAAAVTFYVAYSAGAGYYTGDSIFHTRNMGFIHALLRLLVVVGVAIAWLSSTRGDDARTGRNMAWLTLGLPLVGLAVAAGSGGSWHGLTRLAMAGLLAYAVVQHRLLGLDVKLRWTISKSSVATVFIAVFFIVSEAAQQFFGETLGSTYVGIAAAGALVFAISPLQRAAERLAERAVPRTSGGTSAGGGHAAADLYRKQVALAWTDGAISPNERVMLRGLRKDLGLDAAAADEIEDEVETARMREGASP